MGADDALTCSSSEMATASAIWLLDQVDEQVIRAVVPCTVYRVWGRLADISRLNAILRELLSSELETRLGMPISASTLNKA